MTNHSTFYLRYGKRSIDLLVGLAVMAVALPLLVLLSLLVMVVEGRPIFFQQERAGWRGKSFKIIKFRTMREECGGSLQSDADRLTRLGSFLRETSMDELPTLVNLIRGEMSLVGPRPLPVRYLPRYTSEQDRRHEVKPGVTGWAQVNGRNSLSWEDKFCLDVWYVDHLSIWLDLRILLMTLWKLVKREGISAKGEATMPEFWGRRQKR